jgi:hypothetical protein
MITKILINSTKKDKKRNFFCNKMTEFSNIKKIFNVRKDLINKGCIIFIIVLLKKKYKFKLDIEK